MTLEKTVLRHFTRLSLAESTNKIPLYQCKYCTQKYAMHSSRMAAHLSSSCKGCPSEVKTILSQYTTKTTTKSQKESSGSSSTIRTDPTLINCTKGTVKNTGTNQLDRNDQTVVTTGKTKINYYLDIMKKEDQKRSENLLAKAVFTSGI